MHYLISLCIEVLCSTTRILSNSFKFAICFRVCKKWNRLCKDRIVWRDVNLTCAGVGKGKARALIKQYCDSKYTKTLAIRSVDKRAARKRTRRAKCENL